MASFSNDFLLYYFDNQGSRAPNMENTILITELSHSAYYIALRTCTHQFMVVTILLHVQYNDKST